MADVAAELEIAAEPIDVFNALIDLDRLPQWLSIAVDKLAVPDGALHESDRFPLTLNIAGRVSALRCHVIELHRLSQVPYEVHVATRSSCRARTARRRRAAPACASA